MSLVNVSCGECGIAFCLPSGFHRQRMDDGQTFSCPNGHRVSYRPSELEKQVAALQKDVREWKSCWEDMRDRYHEVFAAREELIGVLKECPGGCGWRSRRQIPRDPVAMGRGIERVRQDVADHLVQIHGCRAETLRELPLRTA